jgi:DNA-binding winged helix-turn-helix (wHTH) protein
VTLSPIENTVRFGLFELDLRTWQLTKNGVKIRLPRQSIQALSLLLERPDEIVTREELRQRLWPSDVFVDFDHGLNKSIQKLRDALGDRQALPVTLRRFRVSGTVSSDQQTGRQKSGNSGQTQILYSDRISLPLLNPESLEAGERAGF